LSRPRVIIKAATE